MSRSAPLTYVCQEVKQIQNTARVSKAAFIATCALVTSIEFSLDFVGGEKKNSKNYTESKYLPQFEDSNMYRQSENFVSSFEK
jgi:hypothetical protein